MLNVTQCDIVLNRRILMGHCEVKLDTQKLSPTITRIQYGKSLTLEQGTKIRELVKEYEDLFIEDSRKPKQTRLIKHRIITNDALPVKQKVRRIPVAWENEINEQVKEMSKMELFALRHLHGILP